MARDEKNASTIRGDGKEILDNNVDATMRPHAFQGGRLATFISFIALIFSGISLYETILKRAELVLHIGCVIHYARDYTQPDDVFVLPVTVTNTGAREAVIVEFQLLVAQAGEGNTAWTSFTSLYSGTNPRTDKQFFSPISIAGRGTSKKRTAFLPGPIA